MNEITQRYVEKYQHRYAAHGDSHLALGWPDPARVGVRHRVMAEVIREKEETVYLLDFGCGLAHMLDHIDRQWIKYYGLDVTPELINHCREKHPDVTFYLLDILDERQCAKLADFDYIVANGVFTERLCGYEPMWNYFTSIVRILFQKAKKGIAFNLMSTHLDEQRRDLFHVPIDRVANLCIHHLSRNFIVRNDYGFYEYTTYVYH